MPTAQDRGKHAILTFTLVAVLLAVMSLARAAGAGAQVDTFFNGDGHDGAATFGAAQSYVPNAVAPVTGAVSAGASSLGIGTVRTGSGSNTVGFANGRLVMVYRSNGTSATPASGDRSAVALSQSTAGHWEFARVQSATSTTLNFTGPLIYSYPDGTAQVIAVPEYTTVSVTNASANITAAAWNGSSGGVVAMLASGAVSFSAAGTVSASGLGFRGGISYQNNPYSSTGCTALDAPAAAGLKGEGFYAPAFAASTSAITNIQDGRGNYANGGGGGDCFNSSGAGGGNKGLGGAGGNSLVGYTNGNQVVGGIGGANLTYNPYEQVPMGGGGGAGDRNNAINGSGGAGGGVVLVRAASLSGSGNFRADGAAGNAGNNPSNSTPYDGAGGGGAGGVVVLRASGSVACGNVSASGGAGGANGNASGYNWTPGGGGGGGATYLQGSSLSCAQTAAAGAAGSNGGNVYGAGAGGAGATASNSTPFANSTVAITAPAAGSSISNVSPTVTGTATANSTVYLTLDGVSVGPVTANGSGNWSYATASLSAASHTVTARSEYLGTSSTTASLTFTIDTTAPAAPLITTPASSPSYLASSAATIAGSAEANSTVTVYDGATLIGTVVANGSGNWTLSPTLAVGSHSITARSTDAANNVSVPSSAATLIVDTSAPTVTLSSPANGVTINIATPTIVFSVADTNSGAISACYIDGVSTTCSSGYVPTTLGQGSHTVRVANTDLAGNVGSSTTNTFTVDTIAPSAPVISTPSTSPLYTSNATPTIAGSAESGSTVNIYADGILVGTVTATGGSWSKVISALTAGTHSIVARATDGAGNVSADSNAKTIVVDQTAPAAPAITNPATSPTYAKTTTPTIAGTAEPGSSVTVYDAAAPVGTATTDGGGAWSLTTSTLLAGSHTLTAKATDLAGNISPASSGKTIIVDTTPPGTPTITTPVLSSIVTSDTTPTVAGTAEAGSIVNVLDGNVVVGTVVADGSGDWSIDTSTLSQGSHTITATATDAAGNVSVASAAKTIVVDTDTPDAPVISTPASSPYYTTDVTPTVGGSAETGTTVKLYEGNTLLATATASGGSWSVDTSTLPEGPHTLVAIATDGGGNSSAASAAVTIIVDNTTPSVAISVPDNGSTVNTATPAVIFTVTDDNRAATSLCSVDGSPYSGCSSGFTTPALAQGSHTVSVRHVDLAGNTATTSATFTVDTIAPAAPSITSGPNGPVASSSASFDFSGEAGASFQCYLDTPATWSTCSSPVSYSSLAAGTHTLHVRQIDAAGNTSGETTRVWSVDLDGPPAPSVNGPSGTVGAPTATITFSDTETPVTFMCSLDSAPAAGCTSPASLSGLANGSHSYAVYALDALGNSSATTTINWSVDTALFSVAITASPTGTVATSNNSISFVATDTSGTTYECKVDAGSYAACTSPFATGSLADGAHTFSVRATKGVQTTVAAAASWTVDTQGPAQAISAPTASATIGPAGTVVFTATDSAGPVTSTCQFDGGAIVGCSSPYSFSGLGGGPRSVTIVSTDAVGNSSTTVRNFAVDATPPNTSITANPTANSNSAAPSFSFSATESPSTFECRLDTGAWEACSSSKAYSGVPAGAHVFQVRASDQYGNVDATPATYSWNIDTAAPPPPVISVPSTDIFTNDSTPSVSGSAEPNTLVRVYDGAVQIGTANVNSSGAWAIGDPSLTDGAHSITARAYDAAGNISSDSVARVITVDTVNPVLEITGPAEEARVGSATPTITFSATDDAPVSITCSVDGGASTACTSPWTTPTLADGPHTIDLIATDAAGNQVSDQRNLTVDTTAPSTPTVDSPAADGATASKRPPLGGAAEAYSTVIVFEDDSPIGSTTASALGRWTFTPTGDSSDGAHSFKVTATDLAGNVSSDSNVRTLTIDTIAPSTPTIAVPSGDTSTTNPRPTLSGSADAFSEVSLYEGATKIASGFADANGDWSATVTSNLPEGAHTIYAVAVDAAGNNSSNSSTRKITLDTTAPGVPTITSPASTLLTNTASQTLSGHSEAGALITIYDGGVEVATTNANGSGDWSIGPATLSEGVHDFSVTATDGAGNTSVASAVRRITVDLTAPSAPTVNSPSDGATSSDTTPNFTGTSEPGATVNVYDGATLLCSAVADNSGNWSCESGPVLSEGPHSLTATATDAAGNPGSSQAALAITIDTTPPSVSITSPAQSAVVTTRTPTIVSSATDASAVTLRCKVDAGAYVACGASWVTTSLSDGSHSVQVEARDPSGYTATTSVTFTVDVTAPTATIGAKPTAIDNHNSPNFTFSGSEGLATFECSLDGAEFAACTSPVAIPGPLGDGAHIFEVRAIDTHGNTQAPPTSYSWVIDTTPPAAPTLDSPVDGSATGDATPTFSGTAEPGSTIELVIDGTRTITTQTDDEGNWSIDLPTPKLSDGPHTITSVTAEDEAGNVSTSAASIGFEIDTTAPTGSVTQRSGGDAGANPTFDIVSNEGSATVTCALDGASPSACTTPYTPAGSLSPGTHTLVVTFTDALGNWHAENISFVIAGSTGGGGETPAPADPLPSACFAKGIALSNLAVSGSKVKITGFARRSYAGQSVSVTYKPTGSKVVARAVVAADGSFSASVKAPKKSLRSSNKTLYRATVGAESTPWTKLARRVASTTASYSAGKLVVRGLLTKPLMPKKPVTITARTGCDQPWATVGTASVKSSGAFSFSKIYAQSTGVIFVKVSAVVSKGGKKPKALRTYSFVMPVIAR